MPPSTSSERFSRDDENSSGSGSAGAIGSSMYVTSKAGESLIAPRGLAAGAGRPAQRGIVRRLPCGGWSPSDERRLGAAPASNLSIAVVGAAGEQHRHVDADGRCPVADAVDDELGHLALADPVGGITAGAAVRDPGGSRRRSRGPGPVAADRADRDAGCRAGACAPVAGGAGDAVDAAGPAVCGRYGPGVDGADVADAAARAGADRRAVAGDRARLG